MSQRTQAQTDALFRLDQLYGVDSSSLREDGVLMVVCEDRVALVQRSGWYDFTEPDSDR